MNRRTTMWAVITWLIVGCGSVGVTLAGSQLVMRKARPDVHPSFILNDVSASPFPSNWHTVIDHSQLSGRRVNLPKPDCSLRPSDCNDIDLLNTLDGFHVLPLLSIPFDGPIDVNSVHSGSVFLVQLADHVVAHRGHAPPPPIVGINQVVFDAATNTLHALVDEMLEQHSKYALVVTTDVLDASGNSIGPSIEFQSFRSGIVHARPRDPVHLEYRRALLHAISVAQNLGTRRKEIAAVSVFTTQSVTAAYEKVRESVRATPVSFASFALGPGGTKTVFTHSNVAGVSIRYHSGVNPDRFTVFAPRLTLLNVVPNVVGTIAAGTFASPVFCPAPTNVAPPFGTKTGMPTVFGAEDVYFVLFLPSGTAPSGGWPVAIWGLGQADEIWSTPLNVAAKFAEAGFATLSIQNMGGGFGPLSTVTVTLKTGGSVTFSEGGRGFDQDGDNNITSESYAAAAPNQIIGNQFTWLQTVADTMRLIQIVEAGMDVDGDAIADLDPTRIYYAGYSGGAGRGTALVAVEPAIRAAVLSSVGSTEARRFSPVNRPLLGTLLSQRTPSLINPPGTPVINGIGGINVAAPFFNENMPLRDQAPLVNTVVGAMEIQKYIDESAWVLRSTDAFAFAPYLRKSPLPSVPVRPVIVTFARGDQNAPNPGVSAFLRYGDLADRATLFRNDLAWAATPDGTKLERNAHAFVARMNTPERTVFALQAQNQMAMFFASDGANVIDPDGSAPLFETPTSMLPEDFGFIP